MPAHKHSARPETPCCWATQTASSSWEQSHRVTCLAQLGRVKPKTCLPPLVVISDSLVMVQEKPLGACLRVLCRDKELSHTALEPMVPGLV